MELLVSPGPQHSDDGFVALSSPYHCVQSNLVLSSNALQRWSTSKMDTAVFLAKSCFAGGSAACAAELATLPLDTAKVRLQVQDNTSKRPYTGLVDCARRMTVEEGPSSLFRGFRPGLLRQASFASLRIGLYEPVRNYYAKEFGNGEANLLVKVASGLTTGAFAMSVAQPTDVVKIRMQASSTVNRSFADVFRIFGSIYHSQGLPGLWRGVGPNIARNSVINAAELATYDALKEITAPIYGDTVPTHLACGLGAGFVATVVGSPFDVIKTRIMNDARGEYRGFFHCLLRTVRAESPLALYKGFLPNFARIGSFNVVLFFAAEQMRRLVFAKPSQA